jgi:hypothetical protein
MGRPSIHMPRWASRIDLEILSVKVERLQDITEEDARAEGAPLVGTVGCPCEGEEEDPGPTHLARCRWGDIEIDPGITPHKASFRVLWNQINGDRAPWDSNPWAWRIEFRRVESARKAA